MKLKNQLIKAIENYVDTVMLPATYSAMIVCLDTCCDGYECPTRDEWASLVLSKMKSKEEEK